MACTYQGAVCACTPIRTDAQMQCGCNPNRTPSLALPLPLPITLRCLMRRLWSRR